MDHNKSTTIEEIFSAEAIAAGGVAYSRIFDVSKLAGNASLQVELSGDGTGKIEWVGTNDEDALVTAFIKPNDATDIVTAHTKTSGPGSDGKYIYPFGISLVGRMAIKVTETGGVNGITVTGIVALQ